MTRRTPKELLEATRKVLEAQRKRKKRNPVIVAKVNHSPEQADDADANDAKLHSSISLELGEGFFLPLAR